MERVAEAGPNPCPPGIVGVGLGGTMEMAAILAKRALLRPLGASHADPRIGRLETEWLERINCLGIGPQGLGGRTTCLAVHIDAMPTHIASIPRMNPYAPALIARGLKAMIGKGARGSAVKEAMRTFKAVYLAAIGGAGALMARSVRAAEIVAYPDLGTEAIRRLVVADMPLIVVNDVHGGDLYVEGSAAYRLPFPSLPRRNDSLLYRRFRPVDRAGPVITWRCGCTLRNKSPVCRGT